jgi:hypothetical protein
MQAAHQGRIRPLLGTAGLRHDGTSGKSWLLSDMYPTVTTMRLPGWAGHNQQLDLPLHRPELEQKPPARQVLARCPRHQQ